MQGRLTNEVLVNDDGTRATFRIAVNSRRDDSTLFIDVVTFKGLAEVCKNHLHKSDEVIVSGRLQSRQGATREFYEVIAQEVEFIKLGEKTPQDFM